MTALTMPNQISQDTETRDCLDGSVYIQDIPVEEISVQDNIRKEYEDIDALKVSIQQYGLLQPITVYKEEERYIVKIGHRRFLAYQRLYRQAPDTFHTIRCIISDARNVSMVQLIENIQRVDLSQRDIFNALTALKEQGFSLKQIGEIMGKSESSVKILFTGINEIKQDPELQAFIETPGGSIRDVVDTKGIPNKTERFELLEQRKAGILSRAEMRKKTKALKAKQSDQSALSESKKDLDKQYSVFLKVNKEERTILITFQEDIPFDIIRKDLKNCINRENLVCIDSESLTLLD
jgi:ParB family chromosome partitioning protein